MRALLDAGVNVSLGSDGACSTVAMNMLEVAARPPALSKVRGDDYTRWITAREALAAGTQGGARALGFGAQLGVIERGALADLVAYRLDTVPFTPLNDPVRQLIYAERGAGLDFAMVAGQTVLRWPFHPGRRGATARRDRRGVGEARAAVRGLRGHDRAGARSAGRRVPPRSGRADSDRHLSRSLRVIAERHALRNASRSALI